MKDVTRRHYLVILNRAKRGEGSRDPSASPRDDRKPRDDKPQGFTLLETIIALGVVLVGIVGSLTLAAQSVRGGRASANEIIAQNLAREGIEVAYAVRNSNWMAIESGINPAVKWDDGLHDADDYSARIVLAEHYADPVQFLTPLDYSVPAPQDCEAPCDIYDIYLKTGVYSHDTAGTRTPFRRAIVTHPICEKNNGNGVIIKSSTCEDSGWKKIGVRVLVTVAWDDQGTEQTLQLEDRLYDWRQ